jgi:hypothetical protein
VPENSLKRYLPEQIKNESAQCGIFLAIVLYALSLFSSNIVNGQKNMPRNTVPDSIIEKPHSPSKAALMSACLPGLGQIYNKKYWKLPIIYAGFGVLTYFIVFNANEYMTYGCAYIEEMNNNENGNYSDLVKKYSADDLLNARESYRRSLEISCLLTGLFYVLNIVDAAVDAHLFTYNINDDLSLKLDPVIIGPVISREFNSGIRLSLRF